MIMILTEVSIICRAVNRTKLKTARHNIQMSIYEITRRTAVPPRSDWPWWHSRLREHRESERRVGKNNASLIWPACCHYEHDAQNVMKEHTCLPTPPDPVESPIQKTKNKNATSSLLLWSIPSVPRCFRRVLITQQKGLIGLIIQWPHRDTGIQVKRHNNTETADWADKQTVNSANTS